MRYTFKACIALRLPPLSYISTAQISILKLTFLASAPDLSLAPALVVAPELPLAPALVVAVDPSLAPALVVAPDLPLAPALVVAPDLSLTPALVVAADAAGDVCAEPEEALAVDAALPCLSCTGAVCPLFVVELVAADGVDDLLPGDEAPDVDSEIDDEPGVLELLAGDLLVGSSLAPSSVDTRVAVVTLARGTSAPAPAPVPVPGSSLTATSLAVSGPLRPPSASEGVARDAAACTDAPETSLAGAVAAGSCVTSPGSLVAARGSGGACCWVGAGSGEAAAALAFLALLPAAGTASSGLGSTTSSGSPPLRLFFFFFFFFSKVWGGSASAPSSSDAAGTSGVTRRSLASSALGATGAAAGLPALSPSSSAIAVSPFFFFFFFFVVVSGAGDGRATRMVSDSRPHSGEGLAIFRTAVLFTADVSPAALSSRSAFFLFFSTRDLAGTQQTQR